ncbi:MAG: septum formation inhibitor Maf, partial [Acidimicrobiaceae bacterium]|nr:septum formation inhibitor Maf [Acidimicrobiaceae bacterium]
MNLLKNTLILASSSPQRFSLLVEAGFELEVRVPEIDESILVGESAESLVKRLAVEKLDAVVNDGECGVAADTVV